MACPTCDHTMQNVGTSPMGRPLFWCGRCGTVHSEPSGRVDPSGESNVADGYYGVPKLVERCREFQLQMTVGTGLGSQYASKPLKELWHRLGIAESINPPDRKTP